MAVISAGLVYSSLLLILNLASSLAVSSSTILSWLSSLSYIPRTEVISSTLETCHGNDWSLFASKSGPPHLQPDHGQVHVVELGPVGDLGAGHAGPLGVDVAHCRLLVQPVELQARKQ
jgi:hypothetical protein